MQTDGKYAYELVGDPEQPTQTFNTKDGMAKHIELMAEDSDYEDGVVVYVMDRAFCFNSKSELKDFLQLDHE